MDTFQAFLETMIRDGILERMSDKGLLRLISIYAKHDLQPPTVVVASAVDRGLIPNI